MCEHNACHQPVWGQSPGGPDDLKPSIVRIEDVGHVRSQGIVAHTESSPSNRSVRWLFRKQHMLSSTCKQRNTAKLQLCGVGTHLVEPAAPSPSRSPQQMSARSTNLRADPDYTNDDFLGPLDCHLVDARVCTIDGAKRSPGSTSRTSLYRVLHQAGQQPRSPEMM